LVAGLAAAEFTLRMRHRLSFSPASRGIFFMFSWTWDGGGLSLPDPRSLRATPDDDALPEGMACTEATTSDYSGPGEFDPGRGALYRIRAQCRRGFRSWLDLRFAAK